MEPHADPTSSELVHHAEWVRALARRLVGDADVAEDLAAQTCMAALERQPDGDRPLRPWLAAVLRNFVRRRARSERRRSARELEAARAEELPGPDELVERLEAHRLLVEELERLEEPLRSTLLLRYFHGVEPSEIARRAGVPAGTVRWRLKRGIEALRERLDARHAGRRSQWTALVAPLARYAPPLPPRLVPPMPPVSAAAAALPGVLVMNAFLKVGAALAALLLVAAGLVGLGLVPETLDPFGPRAAPAAVTFRPLAAESAAVESEPGATSGSTAGRAVVNAGRPEVETPIEPSAASEASVLLRIVDEHDRPLADVDVVLSSDKRSAARTAIDGTVELRVTPQRAKESFQLSARRRGFATHFEALRLDPGERLDLGTARLVRGGAISGRVVDPSGLALADVRLGLGAVDRSQIRLEEQRFVFAHAMGPSAISAGDGTFTIDGVEEGFVRLWATARDRLASYSAPVEVRAGQETLGVELVVPRYPDECLIRGVVLTPRGERVPHAQLETAFESSSGSTIMRSSREADERGEFELRGDRGGLWNVTASISDHSFGPATRSAIRAGTHDVELRLGALAACSVVVTDVEGRPVTNFGARVLLVSADTELQSFPRAPREAGRIEVGVPEEACVVEIDAPGFALGETAPLSSARADTRVDVVLHPLPGLRGVVLRDGAPARGVRVELFQLFLDDVRATHNGFPSLRMPTAIESVESDEHGRFLLTPRAAARFVVRAEADGAAPSESAVLELDPARVHDELTLALTAGGAIEGRVVAPDGLDVAGHVVGVARGDARARTQRVDESGHYRFEHLTPGAWQVALRDQEIYSGSSVTTTKRARERLTIEWDCQVVEGRTTFHDLELEGAASCALDGVLLIDDRPARAWSARLVPFDRGLDLPSEATPLDVDGRFHVSASRPGRYRLLLNGNFEQSGLQFLVDVVELREGLAPWSLALEVETLEVRGVPRGEGSEPELVHLWRGPGEVVCASALLPDADGISRLSAVPLGRGRIARMNLAEPDFQRWESLLEVDVPREGGASVLLP